jgi:TPR repeat protein
MARPHPPTSPPSTSPPPRPDDGCCPPADQGPRRLPWIAPLLIAAFAACALLPRSQAEPKLLATFLAGAGGLALWWLALAGLARRQGRSLAVTLVRPLPSHYVQACVQVGIYAYWGWYWRDVYGQVPLILSQLVFLYAFDALLSWSRGRSWQLGCGPLPIILSTNVFLWFHDDWFALQFLLIAVGSLAKEFLRWERDGRRTHIFNPSAFTLAIFSLGLLLTGSTEEISFAGRIADTLDRPPYIYLWIFLLGLVVQHYFQVTLMTLSAVVTLVGLELTYRAATGSYYFLTSNLPAPVFLGLHLLMTDPSTSPRTAPGRIVFGALYGASTFVMFGLLGGLDASTVYDKLLPVPLLNLTVRALDRWGRGLSYPRLAALAARLGPARLNRVHMACWGAVFLPMLASGYVQAPHQGTTYLFWRQALEEHRPGAERGMLSVLRGMAREGSSSAWNELGMVYLEGRIVRPDPQFAGRCFAKATRLGSVAASANLVTQFLSVPNAPPVDVIELALDQLEQACNSEGPLEPKFSYLIGFAYESGRGRTTDLQQAARFYLRSCQGGYEPSCQSLSRVASLVQAQQQGAAPR